MKNYDIYTMCRSGNHAIIFWILENLGGTNDVIEGCCYWNDETGVYFYNNCNHYNYHFLKNYNYMIKSYEDVYDSKNNNKKIIIIRDFINLISSRYRKYGKNLGLNWSYLMDLKEVIKLWKQQLDEILKGHAVGIIYNRWVNEKEYRDSIADKIDIPNIYDKTDYVSNIGEGSSFCGVNLETSKDDYMERYKKVELPDEFKKIILDDKELIILNRDIFGIDIEKILNHAFV